MTLTAHAHAAGRRRGQPGYDAQQGRLPAAARAKQRDQLAALEAARDLFDRDDIGVPFGAGGKDLPDLLDDAERFAHDVLRRQ